MTVIDSNAGWAYRKHGESEVDDVHNEQEAEIEVLAVSTECGYRLASTDPKYTVPTNR